MSTPGELAAATERSALPSGDGERFCGYGIMGQPFRSGHVLALRRFPRTSIGPGYTSVWHCDPAGRWTMWADVPALSACARYFGPVLAEAEQRDITVVWPDPWTVQVDIDGVLAWHSNIVRTPATSLMTLVGSHLPAAVWRNRVALAAMSRVAGAVLGAGTIRLQGRIPSEQWFKVSPRYVWATTDVEATVRGESLGPGGPSEPQRWLGGFPVPNRGLFAVGQATFETYAPDRHVQVVPGLVPDRRCGRILS